MVSITSAWVDPKQDRPLLEKFPKLAALIPDVEEAHQNLLKMQVASGGAPSGLAEIQAQEAEADAVHDRKLRGVYNVLTGLADLAEPPTDGPMYLALRDRLFPNGLQMTRVTYAAEAGAVEMVKDRLTPADRKLAKAIPLPSGKLQDQIDAWIEAGKRLGALEQKKSRLIAPTGPSRADVLAARNHWITVVSALLGNAGLEKKFTEVMAQQLFGLLHRLEAGGERGKANGDAGGAAKGAPGSADGSSTTPGDPSPAIKKP
ncbi:MAG: hypothetical protein JST54_34735 [Deltaproteobacteria bacterium]|nr:hypothetical protein [Deltaproteobacteria bacterium]